MRLLLLGLMFASLLMSTSIGEAFGDRAWLFVVGYLAIQIGRTAFAVVAFRGHRLHSHFVNALVWEVATAPQSDLRHRADDVGVEAVERAREPSQLSRIVGLGNYTLIVMVVGIVAIAVGDELAIVEPGGSPGVASAVLVFGGPALFLLAQIGFMRRAGGRLPRSSAWRRATAPLSLLATVTAATAVPVAIAVDDTRGAGIKRQY